MRSLKIIFNMLLVSLFLSSCASKNSPSLNDTMKTFYIDDKIEVYKIKEKVPSPITFGLSLGALFGKHFSLGMDGKVNPKINNTDSLALERSLLLHKINLEKLTKEYFLEQISAHELYSKKRKIFSAYKMKLSIVNYDFDALFLSELAQVKIYIQIEIFNESNELVYENINHSTYNKNSDAFKKEDILLNDYVLRNLFKSAIKDALKTLIKKMSENTK